MIKASLGEFSAAWQALGNLGGKELPLPAAFWVNRAIRAIGTELEDYNKKKNDLVVKYGQESNGQIGIAPDMPNWGKFVSELSPLAATEIELLLDPISADALGKVEIKPVELSALEKFILEKVDDPNK